MEDGGTLGYKVDCPNPSLALPLGVYIYEEDKLFSVSIVIEPVSCQKCSEFRLLMNGRKKISLKELRHLVG